MARKLSRRQYEQAMKKMSRKFEAGFFDLFNQAFMGMDLAVIAEAIASGRTDSVVDQMFDDGDFFAMQEVNQEAFMFGARSMATETGAGFTVVSGAVADFIYSASSDLVTEIDDGTRDTIRQYVSEGYRQGRGPKDIARDLIGKKTGRGKHVGGVLSLTKHQASYVSNARTELETGSADYFTRERRDKRLDRKILKFFKLDKLLPGTVVQEAVDKYTDNLTEYRAETVARTEVLRAISAGRFEGAVQAVGRDGIEHDDIMLEWSATMDSRTRDLHQSMNGQRRRVDEPFEDSDGNLLRYPGDPDAPARTSIGCRCLLNVVIDYEAIAARQQ